MRRMAWIGAATLAAAWGAVPAGGQEAPPGAPPEPLLAPAPAPAVPALELSLEQALDLAADESELVWIAEAGVDRAEGGRLVAQSERFPQVSGTADYTRTLRSQFQDLDFGGGGSGGEPAEGLDELPFGRPNQATLGLSLSQNIWNGGQTAARNRAAEARRRAAGLGLDSARAQALLDVIDFAKWNHEKGMPLREALIEAGRVRLRPILMTTIALIAGMIPVALGHGEGADFRAPLGRAVIGGTITSTLLTLLVIPTVYEILAEWRDALRRRLRRRRPAEAHGEELTPAGG